jgi:phenylalanyl-tRNA synthetase alpha chain
MNLESAKITEALKAIAAASDEQQVEQLRVKYLGRAGLVTQALKELVNLPIEERKAAGAKANATRQQLQEAIDKVRASLRSAKLEGDIQQHNLDLTAPAGSGEIGHLHPVSTLMDELVQVFWQMGYQVANGPEVESEWYNFEALNLHADHPARDMQDTFYLEGGNLPRTHTSSVQIRYMENHKPPIRIIAPGKVYRNEDEDARHVWMFHQMEGLVVDKGITLSDLKGTLLAMMRGVLGDDTEIRLRPSFFPYTEPSVELDATCVICNGTGCNTCSGTGWLELGGAGMVHPQVLRNVGIDPTIYSGFAFGFGPERVAAIKYNVPDLREFWRPNLNFLKQF